MYKRQILYWGTVLVSWSGAAYVFGHNEGINKVIEVIKPSIEGNKYSDIKYDYTLIVIAVFAPLLIIIITSLIGYVANQIKEEKKI